MMAPVDKVRENRLRRMADRQGKQLVKCRRRDRRAVGHGLYALVDVVSGELASNASYELTLDQVERELLR